MSEKPTHDEGRAAREGHEGPAQGSAPVSGPAPASGPVPAQGSAPEAASAPLPDAAPAPSAATPPLAVAPLPVYRRPSRQASYDYVDRSAGSASRHRGLRLALAVLAGIAIVCGFAYGAWVVRTPAWSRGVPGPEGPAAAEAAAGDAATGGGVAAAPTTIDICMVGDVLLHPSVYNSGRRADGSYDFSHLFANVSDEVSACDLALVDQETILGGTGMGLAGYPVFNGPQEVGDAEAEAGFDVVLRATNHTMDMGYDGIHSELEFWRTAHPEVAVVGCTDPQAEDPAPTNDIYVYEKDGFRVAVLNYTYGLNGYGDPRGAVAVLDEARVREDCRRAHEEADMVVVCPHWGTENVIGPDEGQKRWAGLFLECGVDVVLGNHPHVMGPVETMTGEGGHTMVCYWSVGNFVSGMAAPQNMVGGMARVTLERDATGACRVASYGMKPLVTHINPADETTYFLADYTAELAATSKFPSVTPDWVQELCTDVLGSAYNRERSELLVTL